MSRCATISAGMHKASTAFRQAKTSSTLYVLSNLRKSCIPFDLVVLLSLSNTVQNAIIGNDNSLTGGHGRIVKHALARELLTHAELMTVLHRQGFDGLDEVEQCVLEPGGTFAIRRKVPPLEDVRHREVMWRLDDSGRSSTDQRVPRRRSARRAKENSPRHQPWEDDPSHPAPAGAEE
jgi:hypothetical protein